jgi:hypothetical protein
VADAYPGDPLPSPHANAASAVGAEIARIALLVRRGFAALRVDERIVEPGTLTDIQRAERELTRLGHAPGRAPQRSDPAGPELQARLVARRRQLDNDRAATPIQLPLYQLRERAGLDTLAFDLFLLALAPEIDEAFGRIYPLLRGATPRRLIDVATAARLLAPEDTGADRVRRALAAGAPLVELGLVELTAPDGAPGCNMATLVGVPGPVVAHVLGHAVRDPDLRPFVVDAEPPLPRARTFVPDELWPRLQALLEDPTALPLIEGPPGTGKRELTRSLCAELRRPLLEIDVARAPSQFGPGEALAAARTAWLGQATLLVSLPAVDPNLPPNAPGQAWRAGVADLVARARGPLVLARDTVELGHAELGVPTSRRLSPLVLRAPDQQTRERLWRDRLDDVAGIDYGLLARSYPITGGTIGRIVKEARVLARARGRAGGSDAVAQADVLAAIDAEFRPKLSSVGRRLTTHARWQDLVLSTETRETLIELEATIRLRDQVLDQWNFGRLVRGRGVSALFYGEPGTGKTMAAGVVAAAAGLPLYQIDTAQLISKWVGETEKNMAEVFRAAEAGHCMLLFDEADAIFGKRTDVNNSTDRYANMQTNFLLTQIELFNGVSILTTNRESVMDSAFQRRLNFRVHFPMPEEDERETLWRQMLDGAQAELGEIEFALLARRLPMSGGYIRNAVLRAGYLAAAASRRIDTALLRHAAELVLRDAGKVI